MKKLHITIALVLWEFAQVTEAQNMYRNYYTNIIPRPTSAVSVVHSNGFVYFFQADGNGKISGSEIDPLSMNPTGNDVIYDISGQNFNFNMNGGFEDANGNFVLFGYRRITPTFTYVAYVIIPSDLSFCSFYISTIVGEFTAGCDGYDQINGEVYMMVNGRELVVIETLIPVNVHRFDLDFVTNTNDYYSDISWDAAHDKFIATGFALSTNSGYNDPFVEVFDLFNCIAINPVAEYVVLNQGYSISNENIPLHVQIDDNNLILYYDLRHGDAQYTHDIIWLSRINKFWDFNLATIPESMFYELPSFKLSAKDMIYDSNNNRLNFLGYLNRCTDGLTQLLAQVNPYFLSLGIEIGQLGATFTGGYCQNDQYPTNENIFYNDIEMFNLAWNYYNPCYPVLIAGVDKKNGSILTETYNISISSCDKLMWHIDLNASPIIKPYSLNTIPAPQNTTPIPDYQTTDNIIVSYLCDENTACSHGFGGKSLKQDEIIQKSGANISISDNHEFVCDGFDGEINYCLYDIAGKLLQQGVTVNHRRNRITKTTGIYLLKAFDSYGNRVVKKIIFL